MAVGIGAISLQEVCQELYGAVIAGQSLSGCFSVADPNLFDPLYKGNMDRLSNFQNYPAVEPEPFVVTWNITAGDTIVQPMSYSSIQGYTGSIDWGDGTTTIYNEGDPDENKTHTYTATGLYDVKIYSIGCRYLTFEHPDAEKIIEIKSWGTTRFTLLSFYQCTNLVADAITDVLDASLLPQLTSLFRDCESITTVNRMGEWDTSHINNVAYMFAECPLFNQDVTNLVYGVCNGLGHTFENCDLFTGIGVETWDVTGVGDMQRTFAGCHSFNGDVSGWITTSVTAMDYTFYDCFVFNRNINGWDVSNVITLSYTFWGASIYNQPMDTWRPGNAKYMIRTFGRAVEFNQDINNWDTSSVNTMSQMFYQAHAYNQPMDTWDTSLVTTMTGMFIECYVFNQNINTWDTSSNTNTTGMFSDCHEFNQPLSNFKMDLVTGCYNMFQNCYVFNQDLSSWRLPVANNLQSFFRNCYVFNYPVNDWGITSTVTNINDLFHNAHAFNQPLNLWDTSGVVRMFTVFAYAYAFNQDISSWNIEVCDSLSGFMTGKTDADYSYQNFDALINSWAAQNVFTDMLWGMGSIKRSTASNAGYNTLEVTKGWNIVDGGLI